MGRKRFTIFLILAITLMIVIFFHKNKEEIIPSRDIEKIGEIIEPELKLGDLAPNDSARSQDFLEKNRILTTETKKAPKSDVEVMIGPHDDFYKKIKENDGDLKKTIRDIDPLKPPVKAEVKINF